MKASRRRKDSALALGSALLILLLGLAAVSWSIDRLPGAHDPPFAYRLGSLERQKDKQPYRLLLGSSRLGSAVQPRFLPPAPWTYNAARPNSGPFIAYLDLRRVLQRRPPPEEVVVELWWSSLASPLLHLRWESALSRPERELYCAFGGEPRWWPGRWDRLATLSADCAKLRGYVRPDWLSRVDNTRQIPDEDGWLDPGPEADAVVPRLLREGLRGDVPWKRPFAAHPAQDRALRELAALCRTRGSRVVFLITPHSPAFLQGVPATFQRDFLAYARRLCSDEQVPLAGSLQWGAESDFVDGSHVIRARVPDYTQTVARQLAAARIPR